MVEDEERPIADRLDGIPTPSQCERVVGHDDTFNLLHRAFQSGRMHHAWLLTGPRGIGKASLALNFAKYMLSANSHSGPSQHFDPELIDPNVHGQISRGAHPELLHLSRPWDEKTKKFKSQLSISEVRKTLPFYGMTAGAGGWRITIVDAADDMNASAANALLKILEEPPKRSLFFIISHSTGRLLTTIRSRCQSVAVSPLNKQDIATVLEQLGVQASDEDKARAGELCEGSVRKAVQLIDSKVMTEIIAFQNLMNSNAAGSAGDWNQVHKIAESLARKGQEDSYNLFLDLATAHIGNQARNSSSLPLSLLAGWAEVWEKATRSTMLANAYNLDKKQVILSLFGDIFEQNRQL